MVDDNLERAYDELFEDSYYRLMDKHEYYNGFSNPTKPTQGDNMPIEYITPAELDELYTSVRYNYLGISFGETEYLFLDFEKECEAMQC